MALSILSINVGYKRIYKAKRASAIIDGHGVRRLASGASFKKEQLWFIKLRQLLTQRTRYHRHSLGWIHQHRTSRISRRLFSIPSGHRWQRLTTQQSHRAESHEQHCHAVRTFRPWGSEPPGRHASWSPECWEHLLRELFATSLLQHTHNGQSHLCFLGKY